MKKRSLAITIHYGLDDSTYFGSQKLRHDICHMHHMQRMCKIISPRVKFYILKVLFEQFMWVSFWFQVIFRHESQ